MKQSEKILLAVLGVVCIVAGYLLLFEEEKTTAKLEQVGAQLESFVQTIRAKVDGNAITEVDQYTLDLLAQEPETSPFYAASKGFYFEEDVASDETAGEIRYSGYLRFGKRAIAIINEVEYAVGDTLVDNDFKVVSVNRQFVTLEMTDENTGRVTSRKIPMVEDDMEQITLRRAAQ